MADKDNTTFGPAQSRYGHFPINFRRLPPGQQGEMQAPISLESHPPIQNLISSLFSNPSQLTQKTPQLNIDPYQGDLASTIRHEAIHGLLYHLGLAGIQAASNQPNFPDVVQAIWQNRRAGNTSQEAPAYTLSDDPNFQIDPHLKMAFNSGFLNVLGGLDKKTAAIVQSMPGNTPVAQGAPQQ